MSQVACRLHGEKRFGDNFRQFVFTGFNSSMEKILASSAAPVENFSLGVCEFATVRPQLNVIIQEYRNAKVDVPLMLLQAVKSTPGLVGLWAERVFESDSSDVSIDKFAKKVPWVTTLTKDDVTTQRNWNLAMGYWTLLENSTNPATDSAIFKYEHREELTEQEIDVTLQQNVLVSPFCMVMLCRKLQTPAVGTADSTTLSCDGSNQKLCCR